MTENIITPEIEGVFTNIALVLSVILVFSKVFGIWHRFLTNIHQLERSKLELEIIKLKRELGVEPPQVLPEVRNTNQQPPAEPGV